MAKGTLMAVSPIKIEQETDDLVTQAAHFLGRSKKDVVDVAVREYIDRHREEIFVGVKDSLAVLDGTNRSAVALLTGLSSERLDELGGITD
ncbi:type II toxin-antitoxin system VapB family antitoxin [Mycobacteroides chelonae]|uniref:hypothetical protein n=1 Tax=Mycobacteroides chelonae TaxID=1774 RepID=UPI001936C8BC|nr:hypothetical protein [Mycobacteroides chelonae]QQG99542.1 type II toxin-antitoxin system VapB family antitoxin [Mycobacteroides chelonae]